MSSRSELFRTQYKPFLASNRDGLYQPWFSVIESFNARENRAFVGRIYADLCMNCFTVWFRFMSIPVSFLDD